MNSIAGLEHPQAAVHVPSVDRIAVSSQLGKLRFYNAENYALLKTLDFGANADTDNMRYDAASKRIYVGYGRGPWGAVAIVDPPTWNGYRSSSSAATRNHFNWRRMVPLFWSVFPIRNPSASSIRRPAP